VNATSRTVLGIALAALGAVGFSFSLVFARISYDHGTNALSIMVVRFALLAILMFLWSRIRGQRMTVPLRTATGCLLVGTLYFVGIGSYLSSVAYLPVSLAVLIFYTFPIITALLACTLARMWPAALEIVALVAAFGGLILALDVGTDAVQPIGLLLAVTASIGVALNMIGSSHMLARLEMTVFSFYMAIGAFVISAVVILANGSFSLPAAGSEGERAFGLMLLTFFIAFLSVYNGIRLIGPVRLSTVMNLEPVATILIAVALLGETMAAQQIFGGAIVVTAVVISQLVARPVARPACPVPE